MVEVAWYLNVLQGAVLLIAILAAVYGFYRGRLPHWVGSLVKWDDGDGNEMTLPDIARQIQETHETVCTLEDQHHEVASSLRDVKTAQIDIAKAVNHENKAVPVDELEEMHFGESGPRRGEFVEDAGELGYAPPSPDDDDDQRAS